MNIYGNQIINESKIKQALEDKEENKKIRDGADWRELQEQIKKEKKNNKRNKKGVK